jgi:hypothetical protein
MTAMLKRTYQRATGRVRAMHQAGVPFLAGTDTPGVPYVFPGFSLHDELALLVADGGFTPVEAIQAATRDRRGRRQRAAAAAPGAGPDAGGRRDFHQEEVRRNHGRGHRARKRGRRVGG